MIWSIFSIKKYASWQSSFSLESNRAEDFSILGKGQRDGITLYQFSWYFEEGSRESNVTNLFNFLMRIFWLISIFAIYDNRFSMIWSLSFPSSASPIIIAISCSANPGRKNANIRLLQPSTKISCFFKTRIFAFSNHSNIKYIFLQFFL